MQFSFPWIGNSKKRRWFIKKLNYIDLDLDQTPSVT